MKHVILFSGGHSSGLVAVEVVRKFGNENVILLNHDISSLFEDKDIKRFKKDVAEYLGVPITYANHPDKEANQFSVCVKAKAFKVGKGSELCTSRLKTEPFMKWLKGNYPDKDCILYYGFDKNEMHRVQRRSSIMGEIGYRTDYPLALWGKRTILDTSEIGIPKPLVYGVFKHANCVGCLKAGWQHWYIVYCTRQDVWEMAKNAEEEIGSAIHSKEGEPLYLEDMEEKFEIMRKAEIPATEHIPHQRFWAIASKVIKIEVQKTAIPCECSS